MPISKGEEWGSPGTLPRDAPVASSDAEAADLVGPPPVESPRIIGVDHGDLARTLGIRQPYDRTSPKQLLPVDAVEIELDDGAPRLCLAHVVAGHLIASRNTVAIMNAAFIGARNLAPRAHPGDGFVDVVTFDLGLSDRLKAWRRMTTGSHLPHPGIAVRRSREGMVELDRPQVVRIDGRSCGRSATIRFRVINEAVIVAAS